MRLNRDYEIERAASKDETRPHLAHCYLDVEKQRLVATDGHMLAMVPVTDLDMSPGPCPKDESGAVHPDVIKQARKMTPKALGDAVVSANGQHVFVGGASMPRPEKGSLSFPPYEQVIPAYRDGNEGTVTIGLDAKLLLELTKAIGKKAVINLTFPLPEVTCDETAAEYRARLAAYNMLDPYVIEGAGEALGVLMPARR